MRAMFEERAANERRELEKTIGSSGKGKKGEKEFAELVRVESQTIRRGYCIDGHYLGIKPIDGVIGSDLLVHLRAQINFGSNTFKIYPKPVS